SSRPVLPARRPAAESAGRSAGPGHAEDAATRPIGRTSIPTPLPGRVAKTVGPFGARALVALPPDHVNRPYDRQRVRSHTGMAAVAYARLSRPIEPNGAVSCLYAAPRVWSWPRWTLSPLGTALPLRTSRIARPSSW